MGEKENEQTIRMMVAAVSARDHELFFSLFSDDVVFKGFGNPDGHGKAALKALQDRLYETFPNRREEVEWLLAKDEWVVARIRVSGTNTGRLWGVLPPTGKRAEFVVNDIYRFEDGLIREFWSEGNVLSVMQQVGMLPAAEGD